MSETANSRHRRPDRQPDRQPDRRPDRRPDWRPAVVAIATAALGLSGLAAPASAAVTEVPELPRNIVVFPERDFLVLEGYPVGSRVAVEVVRSGVVIGTAEVLTGSGAESAEINHPGGDCWLSATPDIRAGDRIRAVEAVDSSGEQHGQGSRVVDVTAQHVEVEGTDLVVHGTARDQAGNPIPLELLEQRIINPDFVEIASIGRRDIRATSDGAGLGTLSYDSPGSVHWTARYQGLSAEARQVALEGQTRILSWLQTAPDGERIGITIYEVGEAGGPGMAECPPLADYGVHRTEPTVVNAATVTRDLVVHGTAYRSTEVTLELRSSERSTAPLTRTTTELDGTTFQAWSVRFDAAAVGDLPDGSLTLDASYLVDGQRIGGRPLTVLKDVAAPTAAPVPLPAAGTYPGPQQVSLSAEPGADIHVSFDGTDPDRRDLHYRSPLMVTSDTVLRAVAVDRAGNRSPVLTARYDIGTYAGSADDPGDPLPGPTPVPANVSEPPRTPQNVVVFPERDFVVAEGYGAHAGEPLTVRVIRGRVEIGRAVATATAGDPSAEVNHPGGACWTGSTPDLRPGDRVEVTAGDGTGDATTVQGVSAQAAFLAPGSTDTVVVTGHATAADGTRLPLDRLEQRIINPDLKLTAQGRRDLRATSDGAGDGLLQYDEPADPTDGRWTATYTGLSPEVVEAALAGQTRIMAWQATVGVERAGITIFEVGEAGGPGMGGCPSAAEHAVTSATPTAIDAALVRSGGDLLVHGVSASGAPAMVEIASDGARADAASVSGHGDGTWTARFPATSWSGLPDGEVTVNAQFDGSPPSRSLVVAKDTVVPLAPAANPGSGTYRADQAVTLSSPDDDEVTLHYTVDNTQADPRDAIFSTQIHVSADTTLRAVAVDRVGNVSAVSVYRYLIRVPRPAAPGDLALAVASDSGATGDGVTNDATPELVGTAVTGLEVELLEGDQVLGRATAADGRFEVSPSTALADAAHTLWVRTRDAGGRTSDPSASLAVTVDTISPTVSVTGPTGLTTDNTPEFGFASSEPGTTVCSPPDLGTVLGACGSPAAYGPLADGTYTFRVRASDVAGNVSAEVTRTFTVDFSAVPAPAPVASLPPGGQLQPSAVPVRVSWASSTAADLARYELYRSTDGGAWSQVALAAPLTTSTTVPLAPGSSARFKVVTVDTAGNQAENLGPALLVSAAQETSAQVTYSPAPTATRWRLENVTGAFGGSVRHDSAANATATHTFSGTSVQWVTTLGPNRGRADVLIDGVRVATAVELHSNTTQARRVAFTANGLSAGQHTLVVRVTGTKLGKSKGTRVDIDAFASLG